MRDVILVVLCFVFLGCVSGQTQYFRPEGEILKNNTIIVQKNKDDLWNQLVPALGKQFFVINNIAKDSGLINISYTGDPQRFIECGRIRSVVEMNGGQKSSYDFPAAVAYQEYVIVLKNIGGQGILRNVTRKMNLEGRMNIIVEPIDKSQTRVTVNTRYLVTKNVSFQGGYNVVSDVLSFNSGEEASFANGGTTCRPTGSFEQIVLSLFN